MSNTDQQKWLSLKDILGVAIEREEQSYHFYMEALAKAVTPAEKKLLQELAKEELLHKEKLEKQLEDLIAQRDVDQAITGEKFEV
ncbi:MAG: hypothetical protein GXO76_05490 [Calditrichaeota bacterium]|nr:hypothetical protein [Calditrichota bacterium]